MAINNSSTKWKSDSEIYDSTDRRVIVVTPDTLDNKLRDFEEGINNKRQLRRYAELVLALLGTLLTANFKDFLGISSSYWFAIFFLALFWVLGSFLWDCLKFRNKYPNRKDILDSLMPSKNVNI